MSDYEAVVIGGGFAGLAALACAHLQGRRVMMLSRDGGATQHFSGAFDIVDPRWREPEPSPLNYPQTAVALEEFIKANPGHIYARLAKNRSGFVENVLDAARKFFSFYFLLHH